MYRVGGFRGAGERHTGHPRIRHGSRADLEAVARQELQHRARHAARVQHPHRRGRDQRRLLRRLGDHRVARGQRRRDLAGEDREREVPWADADEHAASVQRQLVALTGRAGQTQRRAELGACARSVVTQEIDRFAHLGDAVRDALARLAHGELDQRRHLRLEGIGRSLERPSAIPGRRRRPVRGGRRGASQRLVHQRGVGHGNGADDVGSPCADW